MVQLNVIPKVWKENFYKGEEIFMASPLADTI